MEKLIFNIIIYVIITSFLLYLLIYEKKIGAKIKEYRAVAAEKIADFCGVKEEGGRHGIRKSVDIIETLGSAIILVLIIQHFYIGNFLVPTGSMEPTIMPKDRLLGDMMSYRLFGNPKRGDIIVFKEPVQDKLLYTKRLIALPGDRIRIGDDGHLYINGQMQNSGKLSREYTQKGFMSNKEWVVPKKGDTVQIIGAQILYGEGQESIEQMDIATLQSMIKDNDEKVKESSLIPLARFFLNDKYETGPILDFKYDKELSKGLLEGKKVVLKNDYYLVLGDNTNNSFDSRYWGFVSEERIKGKPLVRFWPLNKIGVLK